MASRVTQIGNRSKPYNCLLWAVLLSVLLVTAGCESWGTSESHHDRVSREIDESLAEALAQSQAGGTGENIRVTVRMLTVGTGDYSALDASFEFVSRNVAIAKRPEVFAQSGLKIGVGNDSFQGQLDIIKSRLKSSEESELFVVLADGASGYINVGTEIAVPHFFYSGRRYSSVGYEFRQAGRSLQVTAVKQPGGMIRMELTPVFSKFLSNGGDIELTELTTTVVVREGQSVVIGGSTGTSEDVATALLSRQTGTERKQTLITVTPRVQ